MVDTARTRRFSTLSIAMTLLLLALLPAWQLTGRASAGRGALAALLCVPAAAVLTTLLRHRPRTHTWTILCAIPYVILGVMELIANPLERGWALSCAMLAFAQFIVLAGLLRVQR
jgi:uncharacterized membrane protein